jgi:membrane protein required for colicin V production
VNAAVPALGWVDWTLLAVLALSIAVGLWRGLVFELMALVGWVVAYVLAQAYSPLLAARLNVGAPGSALNQALAFAATFVAVLLVWALLARLVRMLVRATPLTVLDRLLGAVFGALRGALLLLAVATVVAFTPAATSADWTASHGATWLTALLHGITPLLPADVAKHLPA